MKLFDFLRKDATIADLKATDKESVIAELLQSLVDIKAVKKEDYRKLLNKILDREKQGSTGIGKGLAVPHMKQSKHISRMVGVFGRCKHGIDYGAIDGAPCKLFFLILTPQKSDEKHVEALKKVAQLARNPDFCRFMAEAKDLKEIIELLEEMDGA
jgi:PTS system nitrogen regulatory IIA component